MPTVNELIKRLAALPDEDRELPVVLTLWSEDANFHAFGDLDEDGIGEGGEFVNLTAKVANP